MDRLIMRELREWYASEDGSILFICGAPRVGKTWLIEELCKEKGVDYISLSVASMDTDKLMDGIAGRINDIHRTETLVLIMYDIDSEIAIAEARRLILRCRETEHSVGIRIVLESSIVDKASYTKYFVDEEYVRYLRVYPLNFLEYRNVMTKKYDYADIELMKMYLMTGGLPECVRFFYKYGDFTGTRSVQKKILEYIYGQGNAKYREILESVPIQLKSDSSGFKYRQIHKNARKREYGDTLEHLEQNGLIYRIKRFGEEMAEGFKLYMYDVGLVSAMADIDVRNIMNTEVLFRIYKELLVREFVVQELHAAGLARMCDIYYWAKARAKAKLPIILYIEESDMVVAVIFCHGNGHERSVHSFEELHKIDRLYKIWMDSEAFKGMDSGNSDLRLWDINKIPEEIINLIKHE